MSDQALLNKLTETYPDGHLHQDAWFYLTRGNAHIAVTRSDPPTMAGVPLWNVAWFIVENGQPAEKADFMVDVPTAAVLPTVDEITPMLEAEVEVEIPGQVVAIYDNGVITKLTYTPFAGNAGHFGVSALVDPAANLDVEDTDGPFWKAMQAFLAGPGPDITWTE